MAVGDFGTAVVSSLISIDLLSCWSRKERWGHGRVQRRACMQREGKKSPFGPTPYVPYTDHSGLFACPVFLWVSRSSLYGEVQCPQSTRRGSRRAGAGGDRRYVRGWSRRCWERSLSSLPKTRQPSTPVRVDILRLLNPMFVADMLFCTMYCT